MKHRFAALAIALALVFVVAACGATGDDDSADTTSTTEAKGSTTTSETTASTTTTTEPEVDADAQARAESIDITSDDFPSDWDASPHSDDPDPDTITTCSDFDLEDLSLAVYNTEDFSVGDLSSNDGQSIQIGTRVFEDEDTASSILDVLPQDDFISCANDELRKSFGEDSVGGQVAAAKFDGIGDQTEGFSGQLEVTDSASGDTVSLQVAFVAIRTGDLVTGITALGVGQDLDTDVLDDLGDRIVELQASA